MPRARFSVNRMLKTKIKSDIYGKQDNYKKNPYGTEYVRPNRRTVEAWQMIPFVNGHITVTSLLDLCRYCTWTPVNSRGLTPEWKLKFVSKLCESHGHLLNTY